MTRDVDTQLSYQYGHCDSYDDVYGCTSRNPHLAGTMLNGSIPVVTAHHTHYTNDRR